MLIDFVNSLYDLLLLGTRRHTNRNPAREECCRNARLIDVSAKVWREVARYAKLMKLRSDDLWVVSRPPPNPRHVVQKPRRKLLLPDCGLSSPTLGVRVV